MSLCARAPAGLAPQALGAAVMCVCVLLLLLFWEDSGTRAFYLLLFCFVVCYCLCCGQRARSPFAAQPDAALHLHLSTPKEGLSKWLSGKESTCQCRRHGFNPWVRKIPWRRTWQPPPVFLPEESHGQRSLVGYSSWGHKEWDMTEHAGTPKGVWVGGDEVLSACQG